MAEIYDIEVSVVSQKGTCGAGHKTGDRWIIGNTTPGGICLSVYPIIEGNIEVLKYGGAYPWSQNPNVCRAICPDQANPVVFEIKRIKK